MNIYDHAEEKKMPVRRFLDFTLLSNPIGPSAKARNAMRSALKNAALSPDNETRYLRRCIAGREGVEPRHILFGHGSSLILELVFACVKPRRVLVPEPLPSHYSPIFERHDARAALCAFGTSDDPFNDIPRLAPLIDDADMLLLPNPHWMTGDVLPAEAVRKIAERLGGTNKSRILVLDECLAEFTGSGYPATKAVESGNMLILRTFSLYHALAGLRIGYAIGSPQVLGRLAAVIRMGPVGSVGSAGATASLRDREFQKRTAEFIKAEKAYLIDKLDRIRGVEVKDTSCNFLLVRLAGGASWLEEEFLRKEVLVDCFDGGDGGAVMRVPVRGRRQNARFARTLAKVLRGSCGDARKDGRPTEPEGAAGRRDCRTEQGD